MCTLPRCIGTLVITRPSFYPVIFQHLVCHVCLQSIYFTSFSEVRFDVWYPAGQTPVFLFSSFSNTGTRIIYDRKFLLDCRNSPLARTPPCCLPQIPGVTVPATHPIGKLQDLKEEAEEEEKDIAGKQTKQEPLISSCLTTFLEWSNFYRKHTFSSQCVRTHTEFCTIT